MKHYEIYQLKEENQRNRIFLPWRMVKSFDLNLYEKVYEGDIKESKDIDALEALFARFNINHPSDFRGHSLSVSDVAVLDGVSYYCDSYGWVNTSTEHTDAKNKRFL